MSVVRIRKHTYRDREGWLIYGRPKNGGGIFGVKIFTESRASAELLRAKVKANEETTIMDFGPRPGETRRMWIENYALDELAKFDLVDECGSCGCWHLKSWAGDCREDAERL